MATTTPFRTIRNEQGEIGSLEAFLKEDFIERVPDKMGRFDYLFNKYTEYVEKGNWNAAVSRQTVISNLKERGCRTFQYKKFCSLFIKGLAVKGDPNIQEIPQEKSVSAFLDECTDESENFAYGSTKLYAYYYLFCKENNVEPLGFNGFRNEINKSNKLENRKINMKSDKTFEAVIGVRPDYMTVFILAEKAKIDEEKIKEMEAKKVKIDEEFNVMKEDGTFKNVFKLVEENNKEGKEDSETSEETQHQFKRETHHQKYSWKLNTSRIFNDLTNLVFAGKISSDNYFEGIDSALGNNIPLDFIKYKALLDIKYTIKTKYQAVKKVSNSDEEMPDESIWLKSASMFFNATASNILKARSKEEIEELSEVFKKNTESLT